MKIVIKKSILLLAVFVLLGFGGDVYAVDEVDIDVSGDDDRMFNESFIYPGWSTKKHVEVTNRSETSEVDLYMNFKIDNGNTLAKQLKIYVINSDGSYRIGGAGDKYTLWEADDEGNLFVEKLSTEESKTYTVKVKFDEDAGNDTQGKDTQFDIDFTIEGETTGLTEEDILTVQERVVTGEAPEDEIEVLVTEEKAPESATIVRSGEENNGQVAGAETCRSWPFWAWLVMILSYTGIAYIIGRRAQNVSDSKRNLLWQGLVLLGAIGLWYFFDTCRTYAWVPIVASVIGVVLALILFNKESGNIPSTQAPPNTTSGGPKVT